MGAKAILITNEPVDSQALGRLKAEQALPNIVAKSMTEAVDWILEDASSLRLGR